MKRVILSRRSASSESCPFLKSILKVEIWELHLPSFSNIYIYIYIYLLFARFLGNYPFLGVAIWQGKIGFLYNFSSARQTELKIKWLILSRRSASSESSIFVKAVLKVEFRESYSPNPTPKTKCFWARGHFGMSNHLPMCLPICKYFTNSL